MNERPIAIPPFTRFTMCRACIVMVANVKDAAGRRIVVEVDGTPHRYRCNGSKEYRDARRDEERLAELHAMRERGEAK